MRIDGSARFNVAGIPTEYSLKVILLSGFQVAAFILFRPRGRMKQINRYMARSQGLADTCGKGCPFYSHGRKKAQCRKIIKGLILCLRYSRTSWQPL